MLDSQKGNPTFFLLSNQGILKSLIPPSMFPSRTGVCPEPFAAKITTSKQAFILTVVLLLCSILDGKIREGASPAQLCNALEAPPQNKTYTTAARKWKKY